MQEQLANIYKEAQKALSDDLRQNFYDAVNARTLAFRQYNNKLNKNHALFSGAPTGVQMQYDMNTLFPNTNAAAVQAIAKQQSNQESWDEYMEYVTDLNNQAAYYNNLAASTGYQPQTQATGSNSTYKNSSAYAEKDEKPSIFDSFAMIAIQIAPQTR